MTAIYNDVVKLFKKGGLLFLAAFVVAFIVRLRSDFVTGLMVLIILAVLSSVITIQRIFAEIRSDLVKSLQDANNAYFEVMIEDTDFLKAVLSTMKNGDSESAINVIGQLIDSNVHIINHIKTTKNIVA
jgi:hypothetical protein